MIVWLTFCASRRNTAARWNSPDRARWLTSPETATTSNFPSWIIVSIASICSGTNGRPKCRSETWKIVVMLAGPVLSLGVHEQRRDRARVRRQRGLRRRGRRSGHALRPNDPVPPSVDRQDLSTGGESGRAVGQDDVHRQQEVA